MVIPGEFGRGSTKSALQSRVDSRLKLRILRPDLSHQTRSSWPAGRGRQARM